MIVDVLTESDKYLNINKNFKIVFDYLKTHNLNDMPCGRYELKGNDIFFNLNEYETKPSQKLEAHTKYIDIQVVVKGREYMGYTNIKNTTVTEVYNEEKDVMFLTGKVDKILADNTNFLIFFPEDAHMPAVSVDKDEYVKKAIFKILIN